eukprot:CAMPEP_0172326434 /NCGR_PEP_ID=MMETSP1058-20130122/56529_1 /TAXON_ID=83371 /ORGANISM="Detonula confervacea, Strain CCMP 353" /LENGTH=47 /DNA_ID= /DNA_START= /DNA_END= /DNA_ORIENTATION=
MRRNLSIHGIGVLSLLLLCLSSSIVPTALALEATFTPNSADSVENGG